MTWEEIVSGSLVVGLALAFSTGLAHKLYKGLSSRVLKSGLDVRKVSYVEVWVCENCRRLNYIGQTCKQCGGRMPARPRLKTVSESRLMKHLQPLDHPDRNGPPTAV